MLEIINTIAPEHLELCTSFNNEIINQVKNAGSIFVGKNSPEAMGDYIAGPIMYCRLQVQQDFLQVYL